MFLAGPRLTRPRADHLPAAGVSIRDRVLTGAFSAQPRPDL
ncbi:hypothetical protein AB0M11_08890 [Streptomyces sp. NPDC051987]